MKLRYRTKLVFIACVLLAAAWTVRAPAGEGEGEPRSELENQADAAAVATAAEVNELHEVNVPLERARNFVKTSTPGPAVDIYLDLIERYISNKNEKESDKKDDDKKDTDRKAVATILASGDGILFRTLRSAVLAGLADIKNTEAKDRIGIIAEPRAHVLLTRAENSADPLPLLRLLRARYPFTQAGAVGMEMLSRAAFETGDYAEVVLCFRDLHEFGREEPAPLRLLKWYAAAAALGDAAEVLHVRKLCRPHVEVSVELGGETLSLQQALDVIDGSVPAAPASVYVFNSHVDTTPEGIEPFAAFSILKRNSCWGPPVKLVPEGNLQADSFPVVAGDYLIVAERHKALAFSFTTAKRQALAEPDIEPDIQAYLNKRHRNNLMPLGAAADGTGRVFVTLGWRNLYAFDATGGKVKPLWDTGITQRTIEDTPFDDFVFASLPVTDGRRVYIIVREYISNNEAELMLVAYGAATGRLIYAKTICTAFANNRLSPQYLPSSIISSGGNILVSTNEGVVGSLRASDGEVLWLRRYERKVDALSAFYNRLPGPRLTLVPPLAFERRFRGQIERLTLFAPADSNEVIGLHSESGALVLVEPRANKNFLLRDNSNHLILYTGKLGDELSPKVAAKTATHLNREAPGEPPRRLIVGYDAFEFVRRWYMKSPSAYGCGYGLSVRDSWYVPGREVLYRLHSESGEGKPVLVDKAAYPKGEEPEKPKTESRRAARDRFGRRITKSALPTMHLLAAPGRVILFTRRSLQCFKAVKPE